MLPFRNHLKKMSRFFCFCLQPLGHLSSLNTYKIIGYIFFLNIGNILVFYYNFSLIDLYLLIYINRHVYRILALLLPMIFWEIPHLISIRSICDIHYADIENIEPLSCSCVCTLFLPLISDNRTVYKVSL